VCSVISFICTIRHRLSWACGLHVSYHRRRTIFRLGEQKLNEISVGEATVGEKQSRQSNSKYNFYGICFFERVYAVYSVSGAKPQKLGNFWEFLYLLLTVSYRKKIGGVGCTSCSPNNFAEGTTAAPAPPIPVPTWVTALCVKFIFWLLSYLLR